MPKGHIVFDCDGTLVSSMSTVLINLAHVFSEHFNRQIDLKEMEEKYNPDLSLLFHNFGLNDRSTQDELLLRWSEISKDRTQKFTLFDQVHGMLKELDDQDIWMYVHTNRDRAGTLEILGHLQITSLFKGVFTSCDGPAKPHPAGLLNMVGKYDKSQVLMVGDSYTDVQAANDFGCSSIGVTWCSLADEKSLQDFEATYLAQTPNQCLELVKKHLDK